MPFPHILLKQNNWFLSSCSFPSAPSPEENSKIYKKQNSLLRKIMHKLINPKKKLILKISFILQPNCIYWDQMKLHLLWDIREVNTSLVFLKPTFIMIRNQPRLKDPTLIAQIYASEEKCLQISSRF